MPPSKYVPRHRLSSMAIPVFASDSAKDTEPFGPITVPKTACVLTPSTPFAVRTEQRG
jgi:hypothetical protein